MGNYHARCGAEEKPEIENLAQQIQQAMAGQLAAQTRAAQKGASNTSQTPSKRVELSFRGGSLEGSENAVEALLRQLEQAGLTA